LGPGERWGGEGVVNDGIGAATGGYLLNLNIAVQSPAPPPPPAQLQAQKDACRAPLAGTVDAVITTAATNPPYTQPHGEATSTLTRKPRAHQGGIVNVPCSSIYIEPVPGSAAVTVDPPIGMGGGLFNVKVTAGTTPGEVRLRVTI